MCGDSTIDNRTIVWALLAALLLCGYGCRDEDVAGAAGDTGGLADALTDDMACTAYCLGKVCGDDGCGGSCGECDEGAACTDYGQCACIPNCEEKVCGNDGCGNTCGDCPGPQDNCIEGTCSCKSKCGETECGDIGINGANCLAVGVCAVGGVTASGIEEQGEFIWVCNYGQVVGDEGQEETVCDGKDNDCDVLIDEELDWEASNACSKLGVCDSPLLTASCEGEDGWYCLYALISEWEPEETSCDQLDNDCDGYVDEVACDVGEPCEDATNCVSGVCNLTPSGWDAFCSYALNYCVYISPYTGIVGIVDTGKAACADEKTAVLCGNGSWFKKADCSGASPVCWEGNCQVCAPGSLKCDGNNVVKCNSEASGWDNQKVCGEGTFCVGAGTCHTDSEFAISTVNLSPGQSINVDPKVASSASGGFSVVFTARSFPNGLETDILWRQFSSETTPIDIEEELVNKVVAGKQINADIDNFPREEGGYVVVWQDTNGPGEESEGWDIVAQILPEAGPAALPDSDTRILVNTTTDGSQTSPTVVAMVDGIFMVAWEHGEDGVDEPDIFAQRFSPDGSKFGDEFQVNTFFLYEQRFPALTRLADTGAAAI